MAPITVIGHTPIGYFRPRWANPTHHTAPDGHRTTAKSKGKDRLGEWKALVSTMNRLPDVAPKIRVEP